MKTKTSQIEKLLLKIDLHHLNEAQRVIDLFSPFETKSVIEAQRLNNELGYHVSQIRPLYGMSELLIEFGENNLYSPFRGPLDVTLTETTRQMISSFYDDFFKKARENLMERLIAIKQARGNAKNQKKVARNKEKVQLFGWVIRPKDLSALMKFRAHLDDLLMNNSFRVVDKSACSLIREVIICLNSIGFLIPVSHFDEAVKKNNLKILDVIKVINSAIVEKAVYKGKTVKEYFRDSLEYVNQHDPYLLWFPPIKMEKAEAFLMEKVNLKIIDGLIDFVEKATANDAYMNTVGPVEVSHALKIYNSLAENFNFPLLPEAIIGKVSVRVLDEYVKAFLSALGYKNNAVSTEAAFHDGDQGDPVVVLPEKSPAEIMVTQALTTLLNTHYNLICGSERYEEVNRSRLFDASKVLSVQRTMASMATTCTNDLLHLIEMSIYHYAFHRYETIAEATRMIPGAADLWLKPKYFKRLAETTLQQREEIMHDVTVLERRVKEEVEQDWKVIDIKSERFYRESVLNTHIVRLQSCVFSELTKRYNALAIALGMPKMPDLVITVSPRLFTEYTTKLFEAFREFNNIQH